MCRNPKFQLSKVNGAILNNLIYTRSSLHDLFSGISSTMCLNFLLCRKLVFFPIIKLYKFEVDYHIFFLVKI